MRKHPFPTFIAATLLAGLALTGCAAGKADGSVTTSPSGSASTPGAVAKPTNGVADATGKCVDGRSTPVRDGKTITIADCDLIDVMGSKNTITASAVKHLVIEGDGNTVTYSGDEPAFNERGTGNSVQPADTKKRGK